jgi:hypothetical protein
MLEIESYFNFAQSSNINYEFLHFSKLQLPSKVTNVSFEQLANIP